MEISVQQYTPAVLLHPQTRNSFVFTGRVIDGSQLRPEICRLDVLEDCEENVIRGPH